MKLIAVLLLLFLPTRGMTQSPVKQTLAYSRATTSGIPGRDTGGASTGTPFPPTYFIYVVITKDIPVVASRACVLGTSYATTLRRVSSPVVVDQNVSVPTGKKDTLVKRSTDDVYRVELGAAAGACGSNGTLATLAQSHEVVVCLRAAAARWYGVATKIVPLAPAAAM